MSTASHFCGDVGGKGRLATGRPTLTSSPRACVSESVVHRRARARIGRRRGRDGRGRRPARAHARRPRVGDGELQWQAQPSSSAAHSGDAIRYAPHHVTPAPTHFLHRSPPAVVRGCAIELKIAQDGHGAELIDGHDGVSGEDLDGASGGAGRIAGIDGRTFASERDRKSERCDADVSRPVGHHLWRLQPSTLLSSVTPRRGRAFDPSLQRKLTRVWSEPAACQACQPAATYDPRDMRPWDRRRDGPSFRRGGARYASCVFTARCCLNFEESDS